MFEIRLFYLLICDGVGFFYICIFKDEVGLDFKKICWGVEFYLFV